MFSQISDNDARGDLDHHFSKNLIKINDITVEYLLTQQELSRSHKWFGGVKDNYEIHTAGGTAHFIRILTCAYSSSESKFYHASEILERLEFAAQYLMKAQHEDGTIDLLTTNFHSPPDTAFVIEPLCASYVVLNQLENEALNRLKTNLKAFILKAGQALTVGGIHTPNHRWVVCSALARINSLFPDQKYVQRIDEWLHENIDIDPDGQYTEKSTGIYSVVVNNSFIHIARLLNRPELYEPVRRNLKMTIYYMHPNGEIVTSASGRQDYNMRKTISPYYFAYRYMALHDHDPLFAAITRFIEKLHTEYYQSNSQKTMIQNEENLAQYLIHFLEIPLLRQTLPEQARIPTNYVKPFLSSNVVRIRREKISATILNKNTIFFSLHNGHAALEAVRIAHAFFGKGQFQGQALSINNNEFTLIEQLTKGYSQPLPAAATVDDGDWSKMEHDLREQTEVQHLESTVTIIESNGKFVLNIRIDGTANVHIAVELGFRPGGKLAGVQPIEDIEAAFLLKNGFGKYSFKGDVIEFGPGHAEHRWTQLRGAEPKLNAQSVYLTGFTPFEMKLQIS